MKTLEQLKRQVEVPKAGQEVPSEKKLRENEEVYESISIGHDARITVYRNGYVVCMIGRHKTVFPISTAGYYTFGENERDFHERDFRRHQETGTGGPGGSMERRLSLDQEEWQLALYIAGEDRILKNMDTGIRKKTLHTRREKETGADEVFERSWENQMLEAALSVLTEKEKKVVWDCCILQKTETEVGKKWGIQNQWFRRRLHGRGQRSGNQVS